MAENERKSGENGDSGGKTQKKLRVLLRTFGCQMNIRDSEFVAGLLIADGFALADSVDNADIILFNSCSVRKHAEDRLLSNIADLRALKEKRPELVIGLMGCTAQKYKSEILKHLPILDIVCGPGNESDLPRIIDNILGDGCRIIATDKVDKPRPELFPEYRERRFKAYVSISEGCDNFCSYCIVPYVRGRERSRNEADIVKEVKELADRGCREITLLGQNVNSYGRATSDERRAINFAKLLEVLNRVKGIERIRFMTSHPKDASPELFKAMGSLDKVCEHLHLPLQSGSDRILKLMKRRYTRRRYLKLIEGYRRYVPEGSVTTDVIVGFPTESEKDFEDTLDVMKEVQFDGAFTFKYSPRPPAKSASLKDGVAPEVKERRLSRLMDLQCEISRRRNEPMNGAVYEVLVDGRNSKTGFELCGRTRTNKTVIFEGDKGLMLRQGLSINPEPAEGLIGGFVDVKIESVKPHSLIGRRVE